MEKATYYRADGSVVGVLPADGRWPARYAERGFTLQPPPSSRTLCVIEECEDAGVGFDTVPELVAHAREAHDMDVYRNLGSGEIVFHASFDAEDEGEDGAEPVAQGGPTGKPTALGAKRDAGEEGSS